MRAGTRSCVYCVPEVSGSSSTTARTISLSLDVVALTRAFSGMESPLIQSTRQWPLSGEDWLSTWAENRLQTAGFLVSGTRL